MRGKILPGGLCNGTETRFERPRIFPGAGNSLIPINRGNLTRSSSGITYMPSVCLDGDNLWAAAGPSSIEFISIVVRALVGWNSSSHQIRSAPFPSFADRIRSPRSHSPACRHYMSRRPGQSRPGSDSFSIPALVHGRPEIFSAPLLSDACSWSMPGRSRLEKDPLSRV